MSLSQVFDHLMPRTGPTKFVSRIPDINLDPGVNPVLFSKDNSYFTVRMKRMFLKQTGNVFVDYIPFLLSIVEFIYGTEIKRVPFYIGNQLLKDLDSRLTSASIEFRNTRIAGPLPYCGGEVRIFTGLFRIIAHNYAKELFGLADNLVRAFDPAQLTAYLKVGEVLAEGLGSLISELENLRVGGVEDFPSGSFRNGMYVFVNAAFPRGSEKEFWVTTEGDLLKGQSKLEAHEFRDYDYCLIELVRTETRDDYQILPFHAIWLRTQEMIAGGDIEKARLSFVDLVRTLKLSPDLTRAQKSELLLSYKTDYEFEVASASAAVSPQRKAQRTASKSPITTAQRLLEASQMAARLGDNNLAITFKELPTVWDRNSWARTDARDEIALVQAFAQRRDALRRVAQSDLNPDKIAEVIERTAFAS